ncbi:MAG: hypothetical protein NC916_03295 [Candidatus Omnitrophica bacterium]|nr:hypothetical protein [Candidatus Omnitrophota bacterium]
MFLKNRKRAQTVAEYAILIGLVIAAITGVQFFVKSGIQKQIKIAVDDLNANGLEDTSTPFDMSGMTSETMTNQHQDTSENLLEGGVVNRQSKSNVSVNRNETITWQ